jgi:predicted house-cleaning noncanonical NTP pyrophosphatase (MazG superfamily)
MKMRKFRSEKLWRDKMPEKTSADGSIIHVKEISDAEFDTQLRLKLIEEAQEVYTAQSTKELANELADVLEVINTLCELHNLSHENIVAIQKQKRLERGGFSQRQYVTTIEFAPGSEGEQYCLEQPEKYPEIL